MNYFNYPGDFPFTSLENFMGLRIEMTRTLMTLKMNHPKKEYTYEQIQHLTMIYTLCSTIADIADRFDMETDYLLSKYDFDYDDDEDSLFDPKKIEAYKEKEKQSQKPSQRISLISYLIFTKMIYVTAGNFNEEISKLNDFLSVSAITVKDHLEKVQTTKHHQNQLYELPVDLIDENTYRFEI